MNKTTAILISACILGGSALKSQDVEMSEMELLQARTETVESKVKSLQKLKVSGYIQTQYQWAEVDADGNNFKLANRANALEVKNLESFGRFGVRRGRIKFVYESGLVQGVFQPDFTEKGLSFKDVYLNIKDPWFGTCAVRTGIFDRPFGHEISYSSSRRESPERARIFQSLFPDERDLGAMLVLQPAKTSPWNFLKLELGAFAGNGIKPQISSKPDFIGHLTMKKQLGDNIVVSGGVSAYYGGVLQTDSATFAMNNQKFEAQGELGANIGTYAKRQYLGIDAQFSMMTGAGLTQLRGEYIVGTNPGNEKGAYDFKLSTLQTGAVYLRKISGGYIIFTQDFGNLPLTAIVKYDWYDPNTEISGNAIAASGSKTGTGDITKSNIGAGLMWRISPDLRLTAYYDIVTNETTENLKNQTNTSGKITKYGYETNRKDNVFTLRLQYKF